MAAVAAFGGNTCVNCRKDAARGFFDGAACNAPKTVKAEAIARLHEALEFMSFDGTTTQARTADLRALLDAHAALEAEFKTRAGEWADAQRVFLAAEAAHTEALDALEKLRAAQKHVLEVTCAGDDEYMAAVDGAEAVLAKAGRR